jgi:hypothetical protein
VDPKASVDMVKVKIPEVSKNERQTSSTKQAGLKVKLYSQYSGGA